MSFVIETKKKIYKLFPTQEPITAMVTGVKLQPNCETLYGKKTKVFIKITSNLKDDDGDSMSSLFSATASMGEKANLRRFCKQILGYDPGDVYNVTKLLGLTRDFIFETNKASDGRQFSNISGVLKASGTVTLAKDFRAFNTENLSEGEQVANYDPNDSTAAAAPARKRQVAVPVVEEPTESLVEQI
ncbi:MAG: hypothetical protein DMG96_01585 [Acidobacteria bacterium]|nr:MAG: hypothetical protein DMG96_01585 [Acidobacteriota bacterium]